VSAPTTERVRAARAGAAGGAGRSQSVPGGIFAAIGRAFGGRRGGAAASSETVSGTAWAKSAPIVT